MGCNKSKRKHVPVPWPLASYSRQEWIAWRSCFLTYMNEKYIPNYKQGNELLEYIGNIGLEISKNFYYHNESSETDISTLLFKFDVYFIFLNRIRHDNESIDDYIQILNSIAEKTGKSNTEKVIKEKVLQDMKYEKIFEKFSNVVTSFSKITDYESLALNELIFIWEECVRPENNEKHLRMFETKKRETFEEIQIKDCCLNCDKKHKDEECPAKGQKCNKCGDFNHFTECCLKNFITDCPQCGLNHFPSKCSAFGNECSRCKKINHFPWKCFAELSLSCDYCGQNHANNQQCPANNSVCYNCHKTGHYSFKCRSRRNSKSKR